MGSQKPSRAPGIVITQAGVDARYAADYQLAFNSDWPSLQIAYDNTVTLQASGTQTLNHALGFPPLTFGWVIQSSVNVGRIFVASGNFGRPPGGTYPQYPQAAISITWDSNNVYLTNNDSSNSYSVNVKCYNLDISKSVDYTLPRFPVTATKYDPTYGIKVAKHGKSINSTDLRDFILHSRAQSPAVLSVVTGSSNTGNGAISYSNPVNYVPWTLAFYTDSNGQYNDIAPGTQQVGALFKLGSNLTFTRNNITTNVGNGAIMASTTANTNLSLVVLRDPLVVANTKQVIYNG